MEAFLTKSINYISLGGVSLIIGLWYGLSYYYNNHVFNYWQERGIKNPKPIPVLGNVIPWLLGDRARIEKEWAREYGKVYGIFVGKTPRLIIADPEVLNQICVKNFESFVNHQVPEFHHEIQSLFVTALQDEHWRRVRAIMSPTFTSSKIKRMFKFLDSCVEDLVDYFEGQMGQERVDVKRLYSLYTIDAITTCCYGMKLEKASSERGIKGTFIKGSFAKLAMKMFEFSYLRLFVLFTIPKWILRRFNFTVTSKKNFSLMEQTIKQLVHKRKQATEGEMKRKFDDYLQLLLDAELTDEIAINDVDLDENHHAGLTKESMLVDQQKLLGQLSLGQGRVVKLSDTEIIANAMFFLFVGFEASATLLTNTTYLLAFHQDIQQKLHDELLKLLEYKADNERGCSFDYEALSSCKYLDAVLSESMRLISPVMTIDRVANDHCFIEKYNMQISKGTVLNLAYHAIMNDPDYWPEPELFDPERFMPGNKEKIKAGAYCPFGVGPRHCVAMRFSLTKTKLALAKIVMNFKFDPVTGAEYPPLPKVSVPNTRVVLHGIKKPLIRISSRRNR